MKKILIIGQAPPNKKQSVPYDTTMLYEILNWVGISKKDAQNIFDFEAVYDKFPGYNDDGGHIVPTKEQMDDYWDRVLEEKIQCSDKVWLLGNVAKNYFWSKPKTWSCNLDILETYHPSLRNYNRIMNNKKQLTKEIKQFLEI